jgi:TnpA family transposase
MLESRKRLNVLSEAERFALYGLPDFDDSQRMDYFIFTEQELALALGRPTIHAQVHCALQIGYFKAKQAFFLFSWEQTQEDTSFLRSRYFADQEFVPHPITRHEYYTQRTAIATLFGYRLWSSDFVPLLSQQSAQIVSRDVTPGFLVAELIAFLHERKIVRPGYTTLQDLISEALSVERNRLGKLLSEMLGEADKLALQQLLVREETLSGLAALKQDAKHFGYQMMLTERQKRTALEPIYRLMKKLLPALAISQQNLNYYADLVHYYTIYDLRRMKPEQVHLYLLCYAWKRYRQLNDNLIDALCYHMKQLEDETKEKAEKQFVQYQAHRQQAASQVGRLLLLFVDEGFDDVTPFGTVRQHAFDIMPKDTLLVTGKRLCEKHQSQHDLRWQAIDQTAARYKKHLRPLYMAIEFSSTSPDSCWLAALRWMKEVFSKQQKLTQRPLNECPAETIPERLRPYLLITGQNGNATELRADRYEFWIYRQIRKRLNSGEIYLSDSLAHRCFGDELVSVDEKTDVLRQLDIPWLRRPIDEALDSLFAELHQLWAAFDRDLRRGRLKHLEYNSANKTLFWHKPKTNNQEAVQTGFYSKLQARDIADIFRFVNQQCGFLSAFTPLQPRYAKKIADEDSLMAVIIAQAMNHGNLNMAETSDIPYHVLEAAHHQYLRLATLQAANDLISNAIAQLSIFPHYSFDLEILRGSVDGQKFEMAEPTIKARHSRKYFGRGRGVVAYTLLVNHIPLQSQLIGAHEHESHYVFDICYHNTTVITPSAITGDMHSVNKANFAILRWFGIRLEPRFTDLQAQLKHLFCGNDPAEYQDYLIQPVGQIDRQLILEEKFNIDQVVATLGLKEMTQSTLIRKLCNYSQQNRTRRAIFEFDKLIRSIYTLRYLCDPQLQRDVHRSQNRIESYHQLRSAIAQVGGKKQLTGKTDIDIQISNQCGRLIANVIIYYNSAILSRLLDKYQASKNAKASALLMKIFPTAWQHIYFHGHYSFCGRRLPIDLDAILANLALEEDERRTPSRYGFDPIRLGNVVDDGLTEFSRVWA